jgi:hypothetical protein
LFYFTNYGRKSMFPSNQLTVIICLLFLFFLNCDAKQARNTRGVTTKPPSKNLVPRFGARNRKGETRFHFLAEVTTIDYTTSKTKTLRDLETAQLRTKLVQLTTSLEIDEGGDSGRAIGKRLSRTLCKPSRSRNKRLRTRTSRTLKSN